MRRHEGRALQSCPSLGRVYIGHNWTQLHSRACRALLGEYARAWAWQGMAGQGIQANKSICRHAPRTRAHVKPGSEVGQRIPDPFSAVFVAVARANGALA